MDIITIIGLFLAWFSLIGSIIIESIEAGHEVEWEMFLKYGPMLLVIGGTLGASLVGMTKSEIINLPRTLLKAFF